MNGCTINYAMHGFIGNTSYDFKRHIAWDGLAQSGGREMCFFT